MVDGVKEGDVPWSLAQVACLIPSPRCPTLLSKAPMLRMQGFLSPPPFISALFPSPCKICHLLLNVVYRVSARINCFLYFYVVK